MGKINLDSTVRRVTALKRSKLYVYLFSQKPEDLKVSLRKAFLDLDAELRQMDAVKRGDDHSGSTAITAMVTPTHIIAANCGDSRSILVTASGVKAMSEDHKPYNVSAALPPRGSLQHPFRTICSPLSRSVSRRQAAQ